MNNERATDIIIYIFSGNSVQSLYNLERFK